MSVSVAGAIDVFDHAVTGAPLTLVARASQIPAQCPNGEYLQFIGLDRASSASQ